METIKVKIDQDPVLVTGSIQNYTVYEPGGDERLVGRGANLGAALIDFIDNYKLKYDETVELTIVEI